MRTTRTMRITARATVSFDRDLDRIAFGLSPQDRQDFADMIANFITARTVGANPKMPVDLDIALHFPRARRK